MHHKYISETQVSHILKSKKDIKFFKDKYAVLIPYLKNIFTLFHTEDVYKLIIQNNIQLKLSHKSLFNSFADDIMNNREIIFASTPKRYSKDSNLECLIDRYDLDNLILKNKKYKKHYVSLQYFQIKNKYFFDTDTLIELLINDALDFALKESSSLQELKKIVFHHKLNSKIEQLEAFEITQTISKI